MMLVHAVQQLDMQIATDLAGKRSPEMLDQLDIQLADSIANLGHAINGERPPAQIHNRTHQRFIHGDVRGAEADNPFLIAERLCKCLTNCESDVLDRMVRVDVKVSGTRDIQVEQTMP